MTTVQRQTPKGQPAEFAELRMSRNRRTRILVDGNPALSQLICGQIEELYKVDVVSGPHEVLVMNQVRESAKKSLFNLGEALLVECKVAVEARREDDAETVQGIGLILGEDRERAYELAVIDAAFNLSNPLPQYKQWSVLLEDEERRLEAKREKGRAVLQTTRVEFSSMLTEEDNKEGIH